MLQSTKNDMKFITLSNNYLMHSFVKDCSTPSETGYDFTGTTATTYLGTSNAACATGYDGTASPAQIQCEDSGSWTTVTGCTIKGNTLFCKPDVLCTTPGLPAKCVSISPTVSHLVISCVHYSQIFIILN